MNPKAGLGSVVVVVVVVAGVVVDEDGWAPNLLKAEGFGAVVADEEEG